jgi:glycopeptide antibiotics resistance protein
VLTSSLASVAPGTPGRILAILPLLLFVSAATLFAVAIGKAKDGHAATTQKIVGAGLITCSLLVIVAATISGGRTGGRTVVQVVPLRTISFYLGDGATRPVAIRNVVGNLVLFVPLTLGMLLCGLRARSVCALVVAGAAMVEVVQLAVSRSADVDDVILNAGGGLLCIAAWRAVARLRTPVPKVGRPLLRESEGRSRK